MNSILLTCLIIMAVIVVGYLIYMVIGMFLFNQASKQHGVQRTIIEISPRNKKKSKARKRNRRKWRGLIN